MYEQVIRQLIEQCYAKYGWPPRKIAVTTMFFEGLRSEMRKNNPLFRDDSFKMVDIVFGGNTRVYSASTNWSHKPNTDLSIHVIAWEVSLTPP